MNEEQEIKEIEEKEKSGHPDLPRGYTRRKKRLKVKVKIKRKAKPTIQDLIEWIEALEQEIELLTP